MTELARWLRRLSIGVAALAAIMGAGLLPAQISPLGTLIVCAAGLLALTVVGIRRALPRGLGPERADHEKSADQDVKETGELRLARLLFYLGSVAVGQSAFRAGGLTISELMFIAAFGLCILAAVRGAPVIGAPVAVVASVGIFVFGAAVSSFDAQSQSASAIQVLHATYVLLLWPCVGAMVLRTRRQVTTALSLWAISAAVDGLDACAQLAGVHVLGPARQGDRMTGLTTNPNDLGGVTSIALVPALLIASQTRSGQHMPLALLRWILVALVAVGLVLSGSVAGMAAGALALLVWLSSPSVRSSARVAVVAAVVCALAVVVAGGAKVTSPVQRVAQVTSPASGGNNGSGQDRISVAKQAWPRIKRDPFMGTGLDASDSDVTIISHAYSVPYQIHGLPLAAWYETGIFGLAGLMALLAGLAATGWKSASSARTEDDLLIGWALLAAFVAFVTEAMTQPMVFQQYGWITAVMLVAWFRRADAVFPATESEPRPLPFANQLPDRILTGPSPGGFGPGVARS
jgi:O-antigen ligase